MSLFPGAWSLLLLSTSVVLAVAQSSSSTALGSFILQGLGSSASNNESTVTASTSVKTFAFSNTTTSTSSASYNATITPAPTLRNHTTGAISMPSGFAIVNDVIFPTSCAHSDLGCYETCSSYAVECMSSWNAWNLIGQTCNPVSLVAYTTETTVQTFISTDYGLGVLSFTTEYTESATTATYVSELEAVSGCTLPPSSERKLVIVTTEGYTYVSTVDPCDTFGNVTYTEAASTETETYIGTYATSTGSATYTSVWSTEWPQTSTICSYSVPPPTCPFPNGAYDGRCKRGPDCDKCTIYGGTVQLLYFPVSTPGTVSFAPLQTSAINGTSNAKRAVSNSSELVLATYDGLTMTSPSVYISLATVYALNQCNTTVGQARTGSIISLDPTDLSSALGNYHARITDTSLQAEGSTQVSIYAMSFDLKDLNWPYNPYGWEEQSRCNDFIAMTCPIILKGEYNPVLAVPSQIRTLDPAWATCALDLEGLYDPPKALTPVANEAAPTLDPGSGATTTSAEPSPTAASPTPTSTNNAVPGPTTPEAAGSTAAAQPQASAGTSAATAEPDQVHTSADTSPQQTSTGSEDQSSNDPQPAATTDGATGGDSSNNADTTQAGGTNDATSQAQPTSSSNGNSDDPAQSGGANSGSGQGGTAQASQAGAGSGGQAGSQTLTAGASNGNAAAQSTAAPAAVGTVGSGADAATFVSDPAAFGGLVVQSQGGSSTLQVGATGAINGQTFSVNSNGNAVLGVLSTVQLPGAASADASSAASANAYVVAGTTIAAGGSAVSIGSVQYSALPSGGGIVAVSDGSAATVAGDGQSAITLGGGAVATAAQGDPGSGQAQSAYVVSGATISPGSSPVTIDGSTISALPSGGGIVVASDGTTTTMPAGSGDPVTLGSGLVASQMGGNSDSGQGQSAYVVDDTTINPGASPVTIDGSTISALPSGDGLVVASGGTTRTVPAGSNGAITFGSGLVASGVIGGSSSATTINGVAISQASDGVVVGGRTLTAGGAAATISGRIYSVNSAERLVVGSSTTLGQGGMVASLLAAIQDAASQDLGGSTTDSATSSGNIRSSSGSNSDGSRTLSSPVQTASGASTTTASSSSSPAAQMRNWLVGLSLAIILCQIFC